jgi:chromate transporter
MNTLCKQQTSGPHFFTARSATCHTVYMPLLTSPRELGTLFLKLGVIGFGGPAAHIAMMRREVVQERKWFTDQQFLEMVAVTNLIPGPNSTEMAMHIGARRSGVRGLVTAGAAFIVPAVLIVSFISWLYAEHGTSPWVFDIRYGILPVIIAIVVHAVVMLSQSMMNADKSAVFNMVFAVVAAIAYLYGMNELVILFIAGLLTMSLPHTGGRRMLSPLIPAVLATTQIQLSSLVILFLKIGSVLYGSGYVLLAFLERELVDNRALLTSEQLLDAVAIGQITPGPVFSTATFIGWQLHGVSGALVATVGIFAPSFVFVGLLSRILPWIQRHKTASSFLQGVTAASLGLMAGVVVRLADSALTDVLTWATCAVALLLLIRTKLNTVVFILMGTAISLLRVAFV